MVLIRDSEQFLTGSFLGARRRLGGKGGTQKLGFSKRGCCIIPPCEEGDGQAEFDFYDEEQGALGISGPVWGRGERERSTP